MTILDQQIKRFQHAYSVSYSYQIISVALAVMSMILLYTFSAPMKFIVITGVTSAVTLGATLWIKAVFKEYISYVEFIVIRFKFKHINDMGPRTARMVLMFGSIRAWLLYGLVLPVSLCIHLIFLLYISYTEYEMAYISVSWITGHYEIAFWYCIFVTVVSIIFALIKESAVQEMRHILNTAR